jgi:hypothetical protein
VHAAGVPEHRRHFEFEQVYPVAQLLFAMQVVRHRPRLQAYAPHGSLSEQTHCLSELHVKPGVQSEDCSQESGQMPSLQT